MVSTSLALALCMMAVVVGGLTHRMVKNVGIGWQYIRFTVIALSLPTIALLALNGVLTGEASTLIAGAMGYAFAKSGEAPPK